MDLGLSGRTAFISGSTRGIGYAIASALAAEGAQVLINGRTQAGVDAALKRLRAEYPGARPSGLAADLAKPEDVARLLDEVRAFDIDILINNAGQFGLAAFADIDDADWRRYFEVNVMSGVRLARALLPGMLQRDWGRVVFISSESGVNVPADMIHYGTTKAATIALGNGLAKLTRGTGVTVNSVLGGPTYSDGVASTVEEIAGSQGLSVDAMKAVIIGQNQTTLLERFIDPAEIADLVAYLASARSSATNGAALRADGGVLTTTL
ncbi:SDR family oxidoreductase [Gryllotalpicola kribbensis]|uniref:SDR family oxidoreductase n=1 Tax=Gryllotalpicola kribbensis TaxID=993084 RepID=A0ABP8ATC6_9MICO